MRFGTLSNLYNQLGDLYLRGKGLWSGHGKSLGRLLKKHDPDFAEAYEEEFSKAFQGSFKKIRKLTNSVLNSYGGRCFHDYKRSAPKDWRDFKP